MKYEERVPDSLFQTDGHYLGRRPILMIGLFNVG